VGNKKLKNALFPNNHKDVEIKNIQGGIPNENSK